MAKMLQSPSRSALNMSKLGVGKTVMSVELSRRLGARQVLIIAPLGTRLGWQHTFAQQGIELPFYLINSTKAGRDNLTMYQFGEEGIFIVGTELFTRWSWDGRRRNTTWSTQTPDLVIFDESHRAQNRVSKTYKALMALEGAYKLCLSATPTGNSWTGAWSTARWLFPSIVDGSYWRWVESYCLTVYDRFAPGNRAVVGEKNPGEFYSTLPCVVRLEPSMEVPVVYEDRFVDMVPAQRKVYEKFERDLVVYLDENPMIAEVPSIQWMRLRQIALGVPTVDTEGNVSFAVDTKSSKIDAAIQIIRDDFDNEPVLIATHSSKFAKVLRERLQMEFGVPIGLWIGETKQAEREQIKQDFIDHKLTMVVATIPSMAEGVNGFQFATRNILMVSRDNNRMLVEQFIGRVARTGQDRTVRVVEIKCVNTADDNVFSKQVVEQLAMNRSLTLQTT